MDYSSPADTGQSTTATGPGFNCPLFRARSIYNDSYNDSYRLGTVSNSGKHGLLVHGGNRHQLFAFFKTVENKARASG
jgi:hypothetical protein